MKIGEVYSVGRVGTHFVLKGDTSISRQHAEITVKVDGVFIKDLGSKFGSYVGEKAITSSQNNSQVDRLKKNEETQIKTNDKVRFGLLSSLFKLEEHKLVICTSSLPTIDLNSVKSTLEKIGAQSAQLVNSWNSKITHLIVREGKLTIKVANALAKNVPLVTVTFLEDFLKCLESRQNLPDSKNYVPPLKESTLNSSDVNLAVNPIRKSVFRGKRFTFATSSQMSKYKEALHLAGGKTQLLNDKDFKPEDFAHPANVLVHSMDAADNSKWQRALEQLDDANLSVIPEANIALAILHASCALHCNPEHKTKVLSSPATQKKNTTLVKETQQSQIISDQCKLCLHFQTELQVSLQLLRSTVGQRKV